MKAMRLNDPATFAAIGCAVVATFSFTLNDVGIKFLSGDYPLHQVVFARTLVAMALTLAVFVPMEGGYAGLKTKRPLMHLARAFCAVFANMCFFTSFATLDLGEASTIFFISPLLITAFGVVLLREQVGWRRWAAVVVGLLGVVIVLQPGTSTFQAAALLPIAAAAGYGLLHVFTRLIGGTEKASTLAFYIQFTFIFVAGGIGLAFGDGRFAGSGSPSLEFLLRAWIWPQGTDWLVLFAIGIASGVGGYCISQAYRMAQANVIAPFEYLALPFAILWGYLLFGEHLRIHVWLGIPLIVGAGLFVVWREAVNQRAKPREEPIRR